MFDKSWPNQQFENWMFLQFFSDGKFHVVPSGDLHILRADLPSDGAVDYRCKVRNKLTSTEHTSPPFNLIIDGKWGYQLSICSILCTVE